MAKTRKTRIVVYVDADVLSEADRVALRLTVSRSSIVNAAIAAGIDYVEASTSVKRRGQGARPARLPGTGAGYVGKRRPAPTVQQRTLARLGQTILRVNPSMEPDALRDALASELPVHLPGVNPDTLDLDGMVDTLFESHDGNLVPVPGDEPPDDQPE